MARKRGIGTRVGEAALEAFAALAMYVAGKLAPEAEHDRREIEEPALGTTAPFVRPVPQSSPLHVPMVDLPAEWSRPEPLVLPRSTAAPAALAFGIMLVVWGAVSTIFVSAVGVVFCFFALRSWTRELIRED